jgi:hypothetical protein
MLIHDPSKYSDKIISISAKRQNNVLRSKKDKCWNLLSVARRPTGVNSVDSRVTREMANSSVNQASHGHCAGVFIGT